MRIGVYIVNHIDETRQFDVEELSVEDINQILSKVYHTLNERGYNPINQIVGYLQSGDPAYIPRHNEARNLIRHVDRDEIMEVLVRTYIDQVIK